MNIIPGSPAGLRAHLASAPVPVLAPTTQAIAIVLGGGGDPMAEYNEIHVACCRLGLKYITFVGNDQIAEFPYLIDHAVTLHPIKLSMWLQQRESKGKSLPERIWAHRGCNENEHVTDTSPDWAGSTGLLAVKIARELGHTHVVLCGVPMTEEGNHFLRPKDTWMAAMGFRRGWLGHLRELGPYVRSYGGWTKEKFGAPTDDWLTADIADEFPYPSPNVGLKA